MTVLNKILIALGSLVVVALLGIILYLQYEMKQQQATIAQNQIAQQALIDGITKSSSQFATKGDLDNFITQNGVNLKAIQDSVDQLNGTITAANSIQSDSQAQTATNDPSNSTGPANPNPIATTTVPCNGTTAICPNADPFGYQKVQQNLTLNEDFAAIPATTTGGVSSPATQVPMGTVGFSAWQADPWNVTIPARQYNVNSVIATDQNQQMTVYNKFSVSVNGKEYDVPIATAKTVQQVPTSSFSFWNPRLNIGVAAGVDVNPVQGEFTPSIGMSAMSYGKYLTQPDLTVLGVGAGYGVISKRPQLVITPITFNLGQVVPLIHNTYIGPSAVVGTDGNVGAELGIQVGL